MIRLSAIVMACLIAAQTFAQRPATMPTSVLDQTVKDIDEKDHDLAQYKGKVVLIVNVASKCGFTKQYAGLQKLYEDKKDGGLVILGFPANNFGSQEPGSNEQIKEFCSSKFSVTFPMMAKVSVKGDDKSPVFKFLTEKPTAGELAGEIKWNFSKFLIGRDGQLIARYESKVAPDDAKLIEAIDAAIGTKN
jgi:glutathione peroxidase